MNKHISIDVIPKKLFSDSEDWAGICVSRSATLPLVREHGTSYLPGVISKLEKIDDLTCRLQFDMYAAKHFGIDAEVLLQAWEKIAKSRYSSLLNVMKSIRIVDYHTMMIQLAVDIDNLDAYFSNPLLGIPIRGQEIRYESNMLSLTGTSGDDIHFYGYSDFADAMSRFQKGDLDAITGIGLPNDYWVKLNNPCDVFDTTLHVAIKIPKRIRFISQFLLNLPYEKLELITNGQFHPVAYCRQKNISNCNLSLRLVYPDFPPNQEICTWVSSQLERYGITVECIRIPYSDYLQNKQMQDDVLSFIIEMDPWPSHESIKWAFSDYFSQNANNSGVDRCHSDIIRDLNVARANKDGILRIGSLRGVRITRLPHISLAKSGCMGWDDDFFIDEGLSQ